MRSSFILASAIFLTAVSSCNPMQGETVVESTLIDGTDCFPIELVTSDRLKIWSIETGRVNSSIYAVNNKAVVLAEGSGANGNAGKWFAAYPSDSFDPEKGIGILPETVLFKKKRTYDGFPASACCEGESLRKIHMLAACNFLEINFHQKDARTTLNSVEISADVPICGKGSISYHDGKNPYITYGKGEGSKELAVDLGSEGVAIEGLEPTKIIVPLPAYTTIGSLKIKYSLSEGTKEEDVLPSPVSLGAGETLQANVNRPDYGNMSMEERIARAPLFHHINVEKDAEDTYVPSQSTIDVRYAKALGFNTIEGNIHRTKDGKFVVKHGQQGTLGKGLKYRDDAPSRDGDIASKRFEEVTSQWLRDNVVYDSRIAEYCVPIPTLEEFAMECRENDIAMVAQVTEDGVLPIVKSILPENMIIAYDLKNRSDFSGLVLCWKGGLTVSEILAECRRYGTPCCYSWSQFTSYDLDESLVRSVADAMHSEGYILGTAYASPLKLLAAQRLGFDWIASCNASVNFFRTGNLYNVSSLDQLQESQGTYTLYDANCKDKFVKVDIRIRYRGKLSITIGKSERNNACGVISLESDGSRDVEMAIVSQCSPNLCKIFMEDSGTVIDAVSIAAQTVTF